MRKMSFRRWWFFKNMKEILNLIQVLLFLIAIIQLFILIGQNGRGKEQESAQFMLAFNEHLAQPDALICLKARAFLDLTERKEQGQPVDEKNIRKHKTDVFRLAALLATDDSFTLPEPLRSDMQAFANAVDGRLPDKLIFKEMGLGQVDVAALFQQLLKNFQLNAPKP